MSWTNRCGSSSPVGLGSWHRPLATSSRRAHCAPTALAQSVSALPFMACASNAIIFMDSFSWASGLASARSAASAHLAVFSLALWKNSSCMRPMMNS